mmetsp:Transcript_29345/g.76921  ORF Transcript_29345/g.76921 Transcript_29345/m.76921 type:complete len:108 (+) Transcript_29345:1334-1657(+)
MSLLTSMVLPLSHEVRSFARLPELAGTTRTCSRYLALAHFRATPRIPFNTRNPVPTTVVSCRQTLPNPLPRQTLYPPSAASPPGALPRKPINVNALIRVEVQRGGLL